MDSIIRVIAAAEGYALVQLSGDFDLASKALLQDHLRAAARLSADLIVDMRQVEFADCAAVGALVSAKQEVEREGGSLRLLAPPPLVRTIIELSGLTQTLPVHPDLSSATHVREASLGPVAAPVSGTG